MHTVHDCLVCSDCYLIQHRILQIQINVTVVKTHIAGESNGYYFIDYVTGEHPRIYTQYVIYSCRKTNTKQAMVCDPISNKSIRSSYKS